MQLNPYLVFNGQCEEAFKFYAQTLGAKIEAMIPHAGTPAEQHVPAEMRNKIMHARLIVDGEAIMGSDALPGHYQPPKGFSVSVQVKDKAQGDRIFNSLAENGTTTMPFQATFWSPGFGMVTDRFGVPWMVNSDQPA